MANIETSVTELKINKLTKEQYESIASPSNTELYFIKDEAIDYNDIINKPNLSTVALSGSYLDLINKPEIDNPDWNQTNPNKISYIKNKPNLSTVALSGSYNDLSDKPTIPTTTNLVTLNSTEALTSGGAYSNLVSNVTQGSANNKINVTKAGAITSITINNVENANIASKLGTTTVGTNAKPIYINNGVPTQISYTIAKSVPSDAKFTDTTYEVFTGASSSTDGTIGLVKKPIAGDQNKFLKGNGDWASIDALPSQSGQSGKYLTTNGTTASWAVVDALPSQTGNSGKYLTTNGTSASWIAIEEYTASEVETLWNSL